MTPSRPGRDDAFEDHFSERAGAYARYRPTYPEELFRFLASVALNEERGRQIVSEAVGFASDPSPERGEGGARGAGLGGEEPRTALLGSEGGLPKPPFSLAWDCATGSGQAARGLVSYFERIVATDASAEQLARAEPHSRIDYRQALAEDSGLEDASVDLVTVAQALHWLDLDRFWPEVERVLRPGGVIAAWCLLPLELGPETDPGIARAFEEIRTLLEPYWPPGRRHVESGYRTLPFPFDEIEAPELTVEVEWTGEELLGHLGTWSAARSYRAAGGRLRASGPAADLAAARSVRVSWRIAARVGSTPAGGSPSGRWAGFVPRRV